ncbi:Uma2 family endonuclease [Cyanobacterium stanieri LEGE 03274]|uniref:Uma2 family endonuclease n=1 Tax=Cyanobacterium stanieri LEGE 03274 TaxID=1828756 RepID=A0ABR9V488_9CHRO|nr:Uma2 family endonuclease [Cyanobacterium stanieri]MBE9222716.1 Uma2 family endonuclease [Cyanobacterium stanieri LEGE 03274]
MTAVISKPRGENIVRLNSVSWTTFNRLLNELGNKRNQRLTYYDNVLEIMSPLGVHENNNRFIESLIFVIADELGLNLKKFGSLTLKSNQFQQAVEPDSCYYLQNEPKVRNKQQIDLTNDPPPDLVLEIDITSGSLHKLPIYANLGVPEIWRYDGEKLTVFILKKDINNYQEVDKSLAFPFLNLSVIPELIEQSLIDGETAVLRGFRNSFKNSL